MTDWITSIISKGSYGGIVFLMFIENVFPPIPSELIMPLAGYVAAQGDLSFLGVVLAGTAGSVLGALPLYYLGHWVGEERMRRWIRRRGHWIAVSESDLNKATRWFQRHGGKTVFFCRLVPGIRSLISIPAGFARMNLPVFLLYTTVGTALWSAALAYAGRQLGARYHEVEAYIGPVSTILLAAIAIGFVARILRQRARLKRAATTTE